MKKRAFTLAEIMIVLTVIGILTAILMPIAFQSAPDENIMKFKKANSTLGTVVRELANSDKYFVEHFGKKPDGTTITDTLYFCNAFADIVSAKSAGCAAAAVGNNVEIGSIGASSDTSCKNKPVEQIVTVDGVTWWFSSSTVFNATAASTGIGYKYYKIACFDVDGLNVGEDPFSYGIRIDGKIQPGARAKTWMAKSIQKGDN